MLISKFMMSQRDQQTNAMHILSNISRSKSNRTMKLGQLIECNMRKLFVEKSYTKYNGETISRPYSKKSKLTISLDQDSKVLFSLFLLHVKLRAIKLY